MGASMLVASIGFHTDKRFEIDRKQAEAVLAQARSMIEALDPKRFEAINDESGEYSDLTEYRQLLLGDIAAIEVAITGERCDAATISGGPGIVLLVSGGPSWGDPPTELFASISRLREAEVLPDARWPNEP